MAKMIADGNKLVECGEEIISLCEQYNQKIDELFEKISKIPAKAWTGESSRIYVLNVLKDKPVYVNFGKHLKMYGKVLKNTGTNTNNVIRKWNDK